MAENFFTQVYRDGGGWVGGGYARIMWLRERVRLPVKEIQPESIFPYKNRYHSVDMFEGGADKFYCCHGRSTYIEIHQSNRE